MNDSMSSGPPLCNGFGVPFVCVCATVPDGLFHEDFSVIPPSSSPYNTTFSEFPDIRVVFRLD